MANPQSNRTINEHENSDNEHIFHWLNGFWGASNWITVHRIQSVIYCVCAKISIYYTILRLILNSRIQMSGQYCSKLCCGVVKLPFERAALRSNHRPKPFHGYIAILRLNNIIIKNGNGIVNAVLISGYLDFCYKSPKIRLTFIFVCLFIVVLIFISFIQNELVFFIRLLSACDWVLWCINPSILHKCTNTHTVRCWTVLLCVYFDVWKI